MAKKKAWVLTQEHNDYDQHGEYFIAFFYEKPTIEELVKFFTEGSESQYFGTPMQALDFVLHVQSGGGRRDQEDSWYLLTEVESQNG